MKNTKKSVIYLSFLLLGCGIFGIIFSKKSHPPRKKVAFIGFASNDKKLDSLRAGDCLKWRELQSAFKTRFEDLELKQFRFQKNLDSVGICEIYQKIAADSSICLVLDNTWGRHLMAAQQIIRANHIPVIAFEADRNAHLADYDNHALFVQPSDYWTKYNAWFLKYVLEKDTFGFLSEKDYELDGLYREKFDSICLYPRDLMAGLSQNSPVSGRMAANFQEKLKKFSSDVLLVNLHRENAKPLMQFFQNNKNCWKAGTIVLGLPFSEKDLDSMARACPNLKFFRLIEDETIFSKEIERDFSVFKDKNSYVLKKDMSARQHFKNATTVINLVKGLLNNILIDQKQSLTYFNLEKKKIAAYMTKRAKGIEIFVNRQLMKFDANQILQTAPTFEYFEGASRRNNPYQISENGLKIPNFHVVLTRPILKGIDIKNNQYTCNFKYWVSAPTEYAQKLGDSREENHVNYVNFNLAKTKDTEEKFFKTKIENGISTSMSEIYGQLYQKFDTREFPFDKHEIYLPVSAIGPSDELRITFDKERVTQISAAMDSYIDVPGWKGDTNNPISVGLESDFSYKLATSERLSSDDLANVKEYKTLGIRIPVRREPFGAYLLIVLPLFLFGILPSLILFFRRDGAGKLQEGITSVMLTVIVFGYNLVQIAPSTESVNRAFLLLFWSVFSNFFCLLFTIIVIRKHEEVRFRQKWVNWGIQHFPIWWMTVFILIFVTLIPNSIWYFKFC